jgi:hypothetical protein
VPSPTPDRRDADGCVIATARATTRPRPATPSPTTSTPCAPQPRPRDSPRPTDRGHQPPPAKATSFFTTPARPKSATRPTSPRPPRARKSCTSVGAPGAPRRTSGARTNELEADERPSTMETEEASPLSHRYHQLCRLPRTVRPDLAQHARPWIDWAPLEGRYGLCHVVSRTRATSIWRRPSSRPQPLPRTKPRDRKDPDHTRTNRAARASSMHHHRSSVASRIPRSAADRVPGGPRQWTAPSSFPPRAA